MKIIMLIATRLIRAIQIILNIFFDFIILEVRPPKYPLVYDSKKHAGKKAVLAEYLFSSFNEFFDFNYRRFFGCFQC